MKAQHGIAVVLGAVLLFGCYISSFAAMGDTTFWQELKQTMPIMSMYGIGACLAMFGILGMRKNTP